MKTAILLMASACSCLAAIANLRVLGTTATQALLAYTAPDGNACTIQLGQNAALTPLALDVDPGTFANSNSDLARPSTITVGLSRTLVLGRRAAQLATAGTYSGIRHFSRALQAYTPYFGQVTCPSTGATATFSFTTTNIPLGQTYSDPWPVDPSRPGQWPFPEAVAGTAPESTIDPQNGTLLTRVGLRGNQSQGWYQNFGAAYNQGASTACDTGGAWTNPCGIAGGSGNTTIANSSSPLILRPILQNNPPWTSGYGVNQPQFSIDQVGATFTGSVSSASASNRTINVCVTANGNTCAGPTESFVLPTTSGAVTWGDAPVAYYSPTVFGVDPWVLYTYPRLNTEEMATHSGQGTVSGSILTNQSNPGGLFASDLFSLYWATGGTGHIRISSNNDACSMTGTATEYPIVSMTGTTITVTGTPPSGAVYWCENNFGLMIWRANPDANTVTLTAAVLNISGSGGPSYPNNGAGWLCQTALVNGGYFCIDGNMEWINPTTGASVWYGLPVAYSNGVANSWGTVQAPCAGGANACIDNTQPNFTFNLIGSDPNNPNQPIWVQAQYVPASTPAQPTTPQGYLCAQIECATAGTPTAYSLPYTASNGDALTFTNLSPSVTMSESIFQQAAAFDSTWITYAYLFGSPNCGVGEISTTNGLLVVTCSVSQTGVGSSDEPGWLIVMSPGDYNPAHAGLSTGPHIVGMINTFNTPPGPVSPGQPALTGRGLHGYIGIADTGWITGSSNGFGPPLNTSSGTSLPSSGPHPCTFYGLAGNTNDCVAIQLDSHTVGSVTGYDPYLIGMNAPFLNTPGELRTSRLMHAVLRRVGLPPDRTHLGTPKILR